jgi:hypothetical protein
VFILEGDNKAATRMALLMALLFASSLICFGANANSVYLPLKEKELKKGESIISKLRSLEQLTAQSPDLKAYKALMNKLYPELFVAAAELAEGDLKTDLTTAVFLYDEALQRYNEVGAPALPCKDEVRSVYLKLCAGISGNTIRNFLQAKARLHTNWAAAIVNYSRGSKDAETIATMEEIKRERANDIKLGKRVLETLQALEQEVCSYTSLGEFEAHGSLARVSFEKLSQDAAAAIPEVDRILLSLPRGPLLSALYRARNSYVDGLFWWRKTYRQKEMVVSANSFTEPDQMKSSNMDPNVVNYTVAVNWRKAISHTREAAKIIEASQTIKVLSDEEKQ